MHAMVKKINRTAEIPEELDQYRLDQALAKLFPEFSRSQLTKWALAGNVTVDSEYIKPKSKIHPGQIITIAAELVDQQNWQAQPLSLEVIYEDEAVIVINKPAGLIVHPGAGNPDQTLVNALLHRFPTLSTLPRGGLIHRLDKDTSGLLVIAHTLPAYTKLVNAMQEREIKRVYQAIVEGTLIAGGTIDKPLGRHPTQRTKMAVTRAGKTAITHYRIIKKFPHHTHLHVELETGRTHQIRVHLASLYHLVLGDPVYGRKSDLISRQALHAWQLDFIHPLTEKLLHFEAPLPEDFNKVLQALTTDARES